MRIISRRAFRAHRVSLDPGGWPSAVVGDGGCGCDCPPSTASSSFRVTARQEQTSLPMPGSVPWWPRHDWDGWLQRDVTGTIKGFDAKLDVTPETNDTSTSEVAQM